MSLSIKEIRTSFELDLLKKAQSMELTKPPNPWEHETIIPASGVFACGWDQEEKVVLISGSGYSITEPITGTRLHRDYDANMTYDSISEDNLFFNIPCTKEKIMIFGFEAGDGIHVTNDGWQLEVIYPWWPRATVIIENAFKANHQYLEGATAIDLGRLDAPIKCGFSPSGNHLMIMGSGGAIIYSRNT
ncbi:hypothetical protein [Lysinibacillus sp. fls2-241-R2A-57]|uniref:hypothetical protein n=1 Tax=Lysinibacillus sp. fls2-241-R2A-57 TaxID=3040292 RepID=UPI0025532ECD|nr:hypothetical protein [Lysinibacillus sp. fls2-241-R2A-57]